MYIETTHEIQIHNGDLNQIISGTELSHDKTPLICFQNYINVGMQLKYHHETFFILGCD